MLHPISSPLMPAQSVVSELRKLYARRSAIDRLLEALEGYQAVIAGEQDPIVVELLESVTFAERA